MLPLSIRMVGRGVDYICDIHLHWLLPIAVTAITTWTWRWRHGCAHLYRFLPAPLPWYVPRAPARLWPPAAPSTSPRLPTRTTRSTRHFADAGGEKPSHRHYPPTWDGDGRGTGWDMPTTFTYLHAIATATILLYLYNACYSLLPSASSFSLPLRAYTFTGYLPYPTIGVLTFCLFVKVWGRGNAVGFVCYRLGLPLLLPL